MTVPPRGPDVTIIALTGLRTGILCGKYVGVTAGTFDQFLREKVPMIRKAYPRTPVVVVLDNAKAHRSSKAEGVMLPRQ